MFSFESPYGAVISAPSICLDIEFSSLMSLQIDNLYVAFLVLLSSFLNSSSSFYSSFTPHLSEKSIISSTMSTSPIIVPAMS